VLLWFILGPVQRAGGVYEVAHSLWCEGVTAGVKVCLVPAYPPWGFVAQDRAA